jgi:hypothetical protein
MALSFIKSSGNIITEDFCLSLASETKADFVKDKSFGPDVKKVDDIIASTFEKLRERWEENRTQIIGNELDNAALRKKWILPFLESLGYKPIFVVSNIKSESGIEYQIPYKGWDSEYAPVIHMVHFKQNFDNKDLNSRTHKSKSPQDCVQQFLNTSHHQWAILINGKKVRLLRDFYHSITKGFLEFDLESIFETANSEQFRVLYRILHSSRIDNQFQGKQEIEYDEGGNPVEVEDNCLLESFHKKSRETGVKVGNKLRDQVIDAIEKLGNGFAENLEADEFQNGKVKGFYAEILNIIYRLLFLMFAEQKGWLPLRNSTYARTYSLYALRERAERGNYSHDEENDLWEGLKITFKLVANGYEFKNGEKINAFGGQLFSDKKIALIKDLSLKNKFLLDAIYRLSYFKLDNLSNRINYANLAIDELGSVYESLLDYEPKLARQNITIGKRVVNRGEFYLDDRGTDRKTTGSYYTDSRLVAQLIESALVPVIDNALKDRNTQAEKEAALLDLKVADIACGSGAFICAALEKLGERLALVRMGEEERPTEDQLREAKRDILLHCIYGVDLNPMALELAKFSLWITAALPDMPLSFLDHKLKCGNSLIGAKPELINRGIPVEAYKPVGNDDKDTSKWLREKVKKELQALEKGDGIQNSLNLRVKIVETEEDVQAYFDLINNEQETPEEVALAEQEYYDVQAHLHRSINWQLADAWTASFFIQKTDIYKSYPTNETLYNIKEGLVVDMPLLNEIESLNNVYKFFHYHLEFPEVFEKGGFDCLLGNPPWETVEFKTQEYFKTSAPYIANITATNKRLKEIEKLETSDRELFLQYSKEAYKYESFKRFYKYSNLYPLTIEGKINLYSKFTEQILYLSKASGIIVQGDIATGFDTKRLFDYLMQKDLLSNFHHFHNRGRFFDIHRDTKFALLTIRENSEVTEFMFNIISYDEINDVSRKIYLSKSDITLINPNTRNAPILRNDEDLRLLKKLYSLPIVCNLAIENSWSVLNHRMINGSDDSKYLKLLTDFENRHETNNLSIIDGDKEYLPVYESKLMWQYDHRFATYDDVSDNDVSDSKPRYVELNEKLKVDFEVRTKDYILSEVFKGKYSDNYTQDWFIIYRNVTGAVNNRTTIATIVPKLPIVLSAYILKFDKKHTFKEQACFLANINSFVFDFISRRKIGGSHLSVYVFDQIPVVASSSYSQYLLDRISAKVLNLTYTSESLTPFARDLDYNEKPFNWNDKERFHLQCELDAIYSHLYGLEREEMDYILETFPIVKRKDIAKYGSYRTKETILQLYNEFVWVREEMQQQTTIKTEQA